MTKIYRYTIKIIAVFIAQFIYIGMLAHQVAKIQTLNELKRIEKRINDNRIHKSETKNKE